jgi:hypothetical protein
MTTKIKLTDTVLHELADALTSIDHPWAKDYVEAIRALRDAAKTICKSVFMSIEVVPRNVWIDANVLADLLPKKH